jgi:predicted lipid-binding transport protein (Tim44 family)
MLAQVRLMIAQGLLKELSMSRLSRLVRSLIFLMVAGLSAQFVSDLADARAGNRRSMGRSSRPTQSETYRQAPQQNYQTPASAPQRGGFGRALAGGIAGGFLGSMLFSSLGFGAPGVGAAGGGLGLIEIILIAGLAFVLFRWWKSRQMKTAAAQGAFSPAVPYSASPESAYASRGTLARPELSLSSIGSEEATDIFFQVQGAFTRRDLKGVVDRLSPEMYRELNFDIEDLKLQKRINRLENISVRRVDVLDRWNEGGAEYARVRFTANLLDYTVDEISGQIIEGSSYEPVKFEEDWVFVRSSGYAPWQLAGINQI